MRNQIAEIVPQLTARRLAATASLAAFLSAAPFHAALAQTAPSLGTAQNFSVLGGSAVTCTDSVVVGDVGISPGTAFTNTRCTIAGGTPPATNAAAVQARADFLSAYAALQQSGPCTQMLGTTLAGHNLAPGVYCLDAVAKTGTLTLSGPANGVWIFLVAGALTGTDFSVVMDGGGQPCNVFWAPSAAATMTTSALKGNILAGNAIDGSITLTGGSLAGRVLANVAVTMTNASVIGCGALTATAGKDKCDADDDDDNDRDHDRDHDKNKRHHHKHHDRDHDKDQDRDHGRKY
jgi:hypothetical protein